jgi:hypothetical protein
MILTRQTMLILMLVCLVAMVLLAVFFLRSRRMSLRSYIAWGILALLLPFLGPFLVILSHPGKSLPRFRKPRSRRRGSLALL